MIKNQTVYKAIAAMMSLGLVACSSGGGDSTPAGTTAGGTTSGTTVGDTGATTGSTTGGGATANPGSVPNPVLAELTTLNMNGDLRGHKVYAGPEFRIFQEYQYFNIDFQCNGNSGINGIYETYTPFDFGHVSGNFTWNRNEELTDEFFLSPVMDNIAYFGDPDDLITSTVSIDGMVNGDLIVGTSYIENTVVARIVQYEVCDS